MLKPVAFITGMLLASTAYAQSSFTPNQFYGGMMQHQQQQLETQRYQQERSIPQYNAPVHHEYNQPRNFSTPCGGFTGIAC